MTTIRSALIAFCLLAGFQGFSQSTEKTFRIENRYINIPIEHAQERQRVNFKVDGEVYTFNDIRIAGDRKDLPCRKMAQGSLEARYHGFETVVKNDYSTINADDPENVFYYTEAAIRFIKENKKKPFLAVISHNTVHVPHEARADLEEVYRQKPTGGNGQNNPTMGSMIEYLDQSFGLLISSLQEMGTMDHTYVLLFSDNGGLSNVEGRIATSNLPLRIGKSQRYEGGIWVPMIEAGPGVKKHAVADYPVISTVLYPTMLAMAGIDLVPEAHKNGLSLLPILNGEKRALERTDLFWL